MSSMIFKVVPGLPELGLVSMSAGFWLKQPAYNIMLTTCRLLVSPRQ